MISRRSTVIIALAVALLGTPKALEKVGDLWASVQQKTQAKFLGLALNSQAKEQGEAGETPASRAEYLTLNQSPGQYAATDALARMGAVPGRAQAQKVARAESDFEPTLAHREWVRDEDGESWTHSRGGVSHTAEETIALHDVVIPAPVVAPLFVDKGGVVEVTALGQAAHVTAPPLVEKGLDMPPVIKKAVEEGKVLKQKARFVIFRSAPVPPPAS